MNLSEKNILLTGATGGIGVYISRLLAQQGAKLSLVAYPGHHLDKLSKELRNQSPKVIWFDQDLREDSGINHVITHTQEQMGPIDILINNAGIESTAPYHTLDAESIDSILRCNLRAPLFLSHQILKDMYARNEGCIINISSLAGKSGPSCQEVYAATKAGLIGFTQSLRATYRKTGVNASVICPGFVEAGIYDRLKTQTGLPAPKLLGPSRPERVGEAVIRAIKDDLPELIINPIPVRPLFAISTLFTRFGEWLTSLTGAHAFFDRSAEILKSGSHPSDETKQQSPEK